MAIMPVVVNYDWYFVVTCPACGEMSPIGPAPSPDQHPMVRSWPDDVDCPCGVRTHYEPDQIQRRQARPTAGFSPFPSFHPGSDKQGNH